MAMTILEDRGAQTAQRRGVFSEPCHRQHRQQTQRAETQIRIETTEIDKIGKIGKRLAHAVNPQGARARQACVRVVSVYAPRAVPSQDVVMMINAKWRLGALLLLGGVDHGRRRANARGQSSGVHSRLRIMVRTI
ncbi:MAG: hypothetical protein PUK59_05190 [Actinomycetaceae bacterium]|nr:hypothetical protein [Actinomycetaceae bacterium]MDY5854181.1 hypothetical protein [Arcanobacterium sp.]